MHCLFFVTFAYVWGVIQGSSSTLDPIQFSIPSGCFASRALLVRTIHLDSLFNQTDKHRSVLESMLDLRLLQYVHLAQGCRSLILRDGGKSFCVVDKGECKEFADAQIAIMAFASLQSYDGLIAVEALMASRFQLLLIYLQDDFLRGYPRVASLVHSGIVDLRGTLREQGISMVHFETLQEELVQSYARVVDEYGRTVLALYRPRSDALDSMLIAS